MYARPLSSLPPCKAQGGRGRGRARTIPRQRPGVPGAVPPRGGLGVHSPACIVHGVTKKDPSRPPFGSHSPWVVSDQEYLNSSACLQPGAFLNRSDALRTVSRVYCCYFCLVRPPKKPTSPSQRRPRRGLYPGAHQPWVLGSLRRLLSQGSAWHLPGSSGVLTGSKGETENLPGAIPPFDLCLMCSPWGRTRSTSLNNSYARRWKHAASL